MFGSQETISAGFDKIGEGISNTVNSIKSGAASLMEKVPTFEEEKASLSNEKDQIGPAPLRLRNEWL